MKENSALIIVDVQNDFCPGGALPVKDGDRVVPVLNKYIELFKAAGVPVYATRDWHPKRTKHFEEFGGRWPAHCVQGTKGALFHPDLKLPNDAIVITKGDLPDEEGYSGFQGRDSGGKGFSRALKESGAVNIFVGGLATDYCVKETVLDGIRLGFKVTVLTDAVKGVDVKAGDSKRAMEEMVNKGARVITLNDMKTSCK